MESRAFRFQISPYDTDLLLPQVSKALEKRTELVSRGRCPGLWRAADRLTAAAHGRTRSRVRTKVMSAICLALGIFLLVPGLMEPQELFVPLLAGAAAAGVGIGGLWRSRKHKKSRFDRSADILLEGTQVVSSDPPAVVSFSESGVTLPAGQGGGEPIPYGGFERVIETSDGVLLVFDTRAAVLQKRDLTSGTWEAFREFLMEKVPRYHTIS